MVEPTFIDTSDGASTRNQSSIAQNYMTGRSYQMDSRAIPREEVKLLTADELANQTMAALGGGKTSAIGEMQAAVAGKATQDQP